MQWIKTKTGDWPILLFDEVLAELDNERRLDLLTRIAQTEQTLLTTTDIKLFSPDFLKKAEQWQIEGGAISIL